MQRPTDNTNADQMPKFLDLLDQDGAEGMGSVMLRLAHMAAAQHRANAQPQRVKPWSELESIELSLQDKPGQGRPAQARSARDLGPVTTEGDR